MSVPPFTAVWNWLPAFRAAAETQHLGRAAQRLHVSASSLSRTIRQLEDELGQPLFHRSGRGLRLSPAGETLLAALRDGMAIVEHGVAQAAAQVTDRPATLRLVATGPVIALWLVDALERLQEQHDALVPCVDHAAPSTCLGLLLARDLDVAFTHAPIHHDELESVEIGAFASAVYCGAGHPLWDATGVGLAELANHPFAVPITPPGEPPCDNWPPAIPRRAGGYVADLATSIDLVVVGRLLGVLPVDVAATRKGQVRRIAVDVVPPTSVYATRRRGDDGLATRVIDAVRAEIARKAQRDVANIVMVE